MIEYGFPSGLWMSRAVIANAPANLLRKAVDDLMKAAWASDYNCIEIEEVFDRLVQVSTVGTYTPPVTANNIVHNAIDQANQMLSGEDEKLIEEFENDIKNIENMSDDEIRDWLNGEGEKGGDGE